MTLPELPYRASRRSAIAMAAGSGWPVDEPDTVRSLIDLLHSALSSGVFAAPAAGYCEPAAWR